MKTTINILSFIFALLLLFNISCSSDNDVAPPVGTTYDGGILISCEGNFGKPNASITYVSKDLNFLDQNIYKKANNADLGDVLQSIGISGNTAYLVLNNSNKIQLVNRSTFKKTAEITTEISQPRYIAFTANNIYITHDKYNGAKYVSIYKMSDLSFVKKISFTDAAERIMSVGDKIFVQNATYGSGNKISIINTSTNDVENTITLPAVNIQKTISYQGKAYVMANGTGSGNNNSYIYKLASNGSIESTTTITGINNANNLETDGTKFYYTVGKDVYAMAMTATTPPVTPIITLPFTSLYGFNVIDGKIYASDALNYNQDADVRVYSTNGLLLSSFKAGISANGFYSN